MYNTLSIANNVYTNMMGVYHFRYSLFFLPELSSLKSSLTSAEAAKQLEKVEQEVSHIPFILAMLLHHMDHMILHVLIVYTA